MGVQPVTALHVVFAILAVWRLTEIMIQDRISDGLRRRWPLYLWTCGRCVSVWAGLVSTAAFIYFPWANWPFALSWLYSLQVAVFAHLKNGKRRFILEQDAHGTVAIRQSDFATPEAVALLHRVTTVLMSSETVLK